MTVLHQSDSAPTDSALVAVSEPEAEPELDELDDDELVVPLVAVDPESLPHAARNSDKALTPATAVMALRADVRDTRQPPGLMVPCEGPHNVVDLTMEALPLADRKSLLPFPGNVTVTSEMPVVP